MFCPFHHFSKFYPEPKQQKSAQIIDILASTSIFQVNKLIHWDSPCKLKSLHCYSQYASKPPNPQHTHDANWPATKSPRWPISKVLGCPWWFKLLHNPWPDLVTAAYTWRDLLCEVTGPLICIHFVCTVQPQHTDKCCLRSQSVGFGKHAADFLFKINKRPTSSTSHNWSPHFTSFL